MPAHRDPGDKHPPDSPKSNKMPTECLTRIELYQNTKINSRLVHRSSFVTEHADPVLARAKISHSYPQFRTRRLSLTTEQHR